MFGRIIWLSVLYALAIASASAASISVEPLGDDRMALVIIDGELQYGDEAQFRLQIAPYKGGVVVLSGPGGNLHAGMEIGRIIRLRQFKTLVPNDTGCASACALAWLGGSSPHMGRNAFVALHAAWSSKDGQTPASGNGTNGPLPFRDRAVRQRYCFYYKCSAGKSAKAYV